MSQANKQTQMKKSYMEKETPMQMRNRENITFYEPLRKI